MAAIVCSISEFVKFVGDFFWSNFASFDGRNFTLIIAGEDVGARWMTAFGAALLLLRMFDSAASAAAATAGTTFSVLGKYQGRTNMIIY